MREVPELIDTAMHEIAEPGLWLWNQMCGEEEPSRIVPEQLCKQEIDTADGQQSKGLMDTVDEVTSPAVWLWKEMCGEGKSL